MSYYLGPTLWSMKGGHYIIQELMLIVFHYHHIVSTTICDGLTCLSLGMHGVSSFVLWLSRRKEDDSAFQHQVL